MHAIAVACLSTNVTKGQSTLPASCPVCEHSPLSAEDCKPHKALRTTIRVFIRTEEKKREASRPKISKDSAPATPVEQTHTANLPSRAIEPAAVEGPATDSTTAKVENGQGEQQALSADGDGSAVKGSITTSQVCSLLDLTLDTLY